MELKYTKEQYETGGYFDGDMDTEIVKEEYKLVKIRKDHHCVGGCDKIIHKGDHALSCKALFQEEGWKTCYMCIDCCNEWLDELYPGYDEE